MPSMVAVVLISVSVWSLAEAGTCYYQIIDEARGHLLATCINTNFHQIRTHLPLDEFIDYNSYLDLIVPANAKHHPRFASKKMYKVTAIKMIFGRNFKPSRNRRLRFDPLRDRWPARFRHIKALAVSTRHLSTKLYVLANLQHFTNIKRLCLYGFQLDKGDMNLLRKFPDLKALVLTGPPFLDLGQQPAFIGRALVGYSEDRPSRPPWPIRYISSSKMQKLADTRLFKRVKRRFIDSLEFKRLLLDCLVRNQAKTFVIKILLGRTRSDASRSWIQIDFTRVVNFTGTLVGKLMCTMPERLKQVLWGVNESWKAIGRGSYAGSPDTPSISKTEVLKRSRSDATLIFRASTNDPRPTSLRRSLSDSSDLRGAPQKINVNKLTRSKSDGRTAASTMAIDSRFDSDLRPGKPSSGVDSSATSALNEENSATTASSRIQPSCFNQNSRRASPKFSLGHTVAFVIAGLAILVLIIITKFSIFCRSASQYELRNQRSELMQQIDLFANAKRLREGLPPLSDELSDFTKLMQQIDLFANAKRVREGLPPLSDELSDFSSMPHVSFS